MRKVRRRGRVPKIVLLVLVQLQLLQLCVVMLEVVLLLQLVLVVTVLVLESDRGSGSRGGVVQTVRHHQWRRRRRRHGIGCRMSDGREPAQDVVVGVRITVWGGSYVQRFYRRRPVGPDQAFDVERSLDRRFAGARADDDGFRCG